MSLFLFSGSYPTAWSKKEWKNKDKPPTKEKKNKEKDFSSIRFFLLQTDIYFAFKSFIHNVQLEKWVFF